MTVTIAIGNSDNKLTQQEWSAYINLIRDVLPDTVHFFGCSDGCLPWQNACWIVETYEPEQLKEELTNIRKIYRQDSIAIIQGDTQFI